MKRILLASAILVGCGTNQASQLDIIGGEKIPNDPKQLSSFSSAIGVKTLAGSFYGNCTGTRIGVNIYLTAAHCFDHLEEGAKEAEGSVYASNTLASVAHFSNIQVHSGYRKGSSVSNRGVDLATFTIQFPATVHKDLWDKFVTIAPIEYRLAIRGQCPQI